MSSLQERRIQAFTPMRTRAVRVALAAAVALAAVVAVVGPGAVAAWASGLPSVSVAVSTAGRSAHR